MILINAVSPHRMGMILRYAVVSLPIGIGNLAAYLLAKGAQIKIVDELIEPVDKQFSTIDNYLKYMSKPYIFGISCLTVNISRGYEMARMLKTIYPDSIVIFGGIHPTALPEEALNTGYADIVVRGEGEETLALLYDAIKSRRDYSDIAGISFKRNSSIKHNPDRPLIQNLDAIPRFPYELFDKNRYNFDYLVTSRGCPYSCIFCSQRMISGTKYRFRSCEKIIEEMDLLINKYNQQNFHFVDDDFFVDKDRVKLLCELIRKNKFHHKASFGCQGRADNVTEEMLDCLKEAGFKFVGLGIETASERLMKLLNKKETVADNIKAVKLLKKKGFDACSSFIFGLPSETEQDRFETYMLAKKLNLSYAKFNNAVPYPGTKLFQIAEKEGTLQIMKDWENFNSVEGVVKGLFSKLKLPYVPSNTTEKKLRRDLVRANLYFYFTSIGSIFASRKGNPAWFWLPSRWYLKPKEYFYLVKLMSQVFFNCVIVFDPKWFIKELSWHIWKKRKGQSCLEKEITV